MGEVTANAALRAAREKAKAVIAAERKEAKREGFYNGIGFCVVAFVAAMVVSNFWTVALVPLPPTGATNAKNK